MILRTQKSARSAHMNTSVLLRDSTKLNEKANQIKSEFQRRYGKCRCTSTAAWELKLNTYREGCRDAQIGEEYLSNTRFHE